MIRATYSSVFIRCFVTLLLLIKSHYAFGQVISSQDSLKYDSLLDVASPQELIKLFEDSNFTIWANQRLQKLFPSTEPSFAGTRQVLHIHYDGDNLDLQLVVTGKDTCAFLKESILNSKLRIIRSMDIGYVFHDGKTHLIYNCNDGERLVKSGDNVIYSVSFCKTPILLNGVDSLVFRIASIHADSILFSYTGNSSVESATPIPFTFTQDTIMWKAVDMITVDDSVTFTIDFRGTHSDLFSFSRYTLQEKNKTTSFSWLMGVLSKLVMTIPFWLLFYYVLKLKKRINEADKSIITGVVTGIPIVVCLYYVYMFADIFLEFERFPPIGETSNSKKQIVSLLINRGVAILLFSVLYIGAYIAKRNFFKKEWAEIGYKIIRSFLWSISAYVLLGVLNFCFIAIVSKGNYDFTDCMHLFTTVRYSYALLLVIYFFSILAINRLFSFHKKYKYIIFSFLIVVLVFEIVRAINYIPQSNRIILESFQSMTYILLLFFLLFPAVIAGSILEKFNSNNKIVFAVAGGLFLILFSCYSITALDFFFYVPITFLMSLFVIRIISVTDIRERILLAKLEQNVYVLFKRVPELYSKMFEVIALERIKEKYSKRFTNGDLTPSEYDMAINDLDLKINEAFPSSEEKNYITRRLEFGPYEDYKKNAQYAALTTTILSVLLISIYIKAFSLPASSFSLSSESDQIFFHTFKLVLASFALSYFFPYIKGNSGWKKGLYMGIGIAISELPYNFLVADNINGLLIIVPIMREILILTLTGFIAFDLKTITSIYGKKFRLGHIAQIEGWKSIAGFTSVILGAILAGLLAFMSGTVSELLKTFFNK